jgi:hypothetical protein
MAANERPVYGPAPPPDSFDTTSPLLLYTSHRSKRASVFKRAAIASKRKIWDSNDASIDAAQSAVDQWEAAYNALRGLLVASAHSAQGLYGAAKAGATGLEHGFLLPLRDWILLPAFGGVERIAGETVGFLQSDQAAQLADTSLDIVKKVPFIGDNLLAPGLVIGVEWAQKAWEIAQYPIPSKAAVRDSVDHVLTGTKWVLSTAAREIYFYTKRMDANITRTLSHTQWRVLGSGPYSTLDKLHKSEILDHLCERYFSQRDDISRYELAAHIRAHNRHLYHDLVLTGLLRERGGALTEDDEWLALEPAYRSLESPFLIETDGKDTVSPLWFRLPYTNGKRPGKEVPWVCFSGKERRKLEERYKAIVRNSQEGNTSPLISGPHAEAEGSSVESDHPPTESKSPKYPTLARWYEPDLERDLLVDQQRHAVSFLPTCIQCGDFHKAATPPLRPKQYGDLCDDCIKGNHQWPEAKFAPPPLAGIMRPTLWRFHGPGDELRRGVWFLDTKRHGLQPYDDESAAILEDAYLFLKWRAEQGVNVDAIEGSLLTVQVTSPDGAEQQLVQFSSLTAATAIQKTLGGAISIFKRRVYRGASMQPLPSSADNSERLDERSVDSYGDSFRETNAIPVGLMPLNADAASVDFDIGSQQVNEDRSQGEVSIDSKATLAVRISDLMQTSFGEDDESEEKDIDHLVLIIHGIGEMLKTIDVFGLLLPNIASIVDCCGFLRKNHEDIQTAQTKLATRGRVEYLPIEWHEAFALSSQRRHPDDSEHSLPRRPRSPNATMNDISLRTIPQMRAFANDTLMDVLYFMSPNHHDTIIDIVTHEMNLVVSKVYNLTNFSGKVSVLGHSLGSIITFDILANQMPPAVKNGIPMNDCPEVLPRKAQVRNAEYMEDADPVTPVDEPVVDSSLMHSVSDEERAWQNSESCTYPQLDFAVDNAFLLGSPCAVFLMIRNQRKPLSQDFSLNGCSRVFNIFHPYDPVAYRIEPLLDPKNADVEPRIMTHWNGGFRVQYHTKRLFKKIVNETLRAQQNVIDAVEDRMTRIGLLDCNLDTLDMDDDDDDMEDDYGYSSDDSNGTRRVVCGSLNEGRRIDYMLQEKEIEHANEYVAALAAHSSYWIEKDLSLFVAQQILHSTVEASIADSRVVSPESFMS